MPSLVVRYPDGHTTAHPLTPGGRLVVGRAPAGEGAIQLDSPAVSGTHAAFWMDENGTPFVRDEDSANGVFLNGRRLTPGEPAELRDGDQVVIDEFCLSFRAATEPASPEEQGEGAQASPDAASEAERSSAGDGASLILITGVEGRQPGEVIPIPTRVAIIGRLPECSIVLSHPSVSSRHARLELREGQWRVVDLESTNGVFVNEEQILPNDPREISDGDVLRIGLVALQFSLPEQARPEKAAQGPPVSVKITAAHMWGLAAAVVVAFLFLQSVWSAIHWRAKRAYRRREWKEVQRLVDKLPSLYLFWSNAQQLREYAITDAAKSALVRKLNDFPDLLRPDDVLQFLALYRRIPEDAALYPEAQQIARRRVAGYFKQWIEAIRSDLSPERSFGEHATLLDELPSLQKRLREAEDALHHLDVRTTLQRGDMKPLERALEECRVRIQRLQTLKQAADAAALPVPRDLPALRQAQDDLQARLRRLENPRAKAEFLQCGYTGLYAQTLEAVRTRRDALKRTLESYDKARKLLREALSGKLSFEERFDRVDQAQDLLRAVAAENLRTEAAADCAACRKALTAFESAGRAYKLEDFALMRGAFEAKFDFKDAALRRVVEAQKWGSLRVCERAKMWRSEYVQVRSMPSLAADRMARLQAGHEKLCQYEEEAFLLPARRSARCARLALVAYLNDDAPEALAFARRAGPAVWKRANLLVDEYSHAVDLIPRVEKALKQVEGDPTDVPLAAFDAARRGLQSLAAARDAVAERERALFALVDADFHLPAGGPFLRMVAKRYARLDGRRGRACDRLAADAEKILESLRKTLAGDDSVVTRPIPADRVQWVRLISLCGKAANLAGAGRLEPLLEQVLGLLIPARLDRMDSAARGFWRFLLKQIEDFPELPRRIEIFVQYKMQGL